MKFYLNNQLVTLQELININNNYNLKINNIVFKNNQILVFFNKKIQLKNFLTF
jgi:hypothetical protein